MYRITRECTHPDVVNARDQYVERCVSANKYLPITEQRNGIDDYFKLHAATSDTMQTFRYWDGYGRERFYTIATYTGRHAGSIEPFESIAYVSTENGTPIGDAWNECEILLSGNNQMALHYATIFEMRTKSQYWWDPEIHPLEN